MKSSMKARLSSLNLFNKCGSCAPVSSCCDPCNSMVSGGYVMDGVVIGEYSPYSMQPPVYQSAPMQYSMPPVGQYQYPQPMMAQPPCATCQNQASQSWQPYLPAAPVYQQPSYPPAYGQQPTPPQNWQQPQPTYQYPQPVSPQPVQPQPAPATTRIQPMPAPASQVSYLPGYSNAVSPVSRRYR